MNHRLTRMALAATTSILGHQAMQAQGIASEQQLQTVTVTGSAVRSPLDPNLPSTTASKTAEELRRQQNIFNPEEGSYRDTAKIDT